MSFREGEFFEEYDTSFILVSRKILICGSKIKICIEIFGANLLQQILISFNFRFSPCILTVNYFYYPTNALNYIKL